MFDKREAREAEKKCRAMTKEKPKSVKKLTKKERQILETAQNTVLPDHYFTVWTEEELRELCGWLEPLTEVAIDTETMGLQPFKDPIVGISFYAPHRGYYIPLRHADPEVQCLPLELVAKVLKPLLEDPKKQWLLHNAKFDIHVLWKWLGIELKPFFDTMIAQALLDENQSKRLKDLATLYLKIPADNFNELFGNVTFDKVPIKMDPVTRRGNLATYYATKDTELTYKLYEFQKMHLDNPLLANLKNLMFNLEMPFLDVVVKAERRGVRMDEDYLRNEVAPQLKAEVEELRKKIHEYTGEINLNSPKQVAEALYGKLKLPKVNKDTPLSTNKRTLKLLTAHHPVAKLLLDYRAKEKLYTAFAVKLPELVIDGRVHCNFQTLGTKTGRMSCIAEGTLIEVLNGRKPIEEVEVGDLVYCYDDKGELVLSKVLRVIDNGLRPCVKVRWRSRGKHDRGELICTPDHKIRTRDKGWVEAQSLEKGDVVFHLRRSKSGDGRPRFYGTNGIDIQEQALIKKWVFNCHSPRQHIHHKDGDVSNNALDNLELLDDSEHHSLHAKRDPDYFRRIGNHNNRTHPSGEDHYNHMKITAAELEDLVRSHEGRISSIPMDFNTFKKKCEEVGFDYRKVAGEYLKRYRDIDDDLFISTFMECRGVPYAIAKKLGIGRSKVVKKIKQLDLTYNHTVLGVEPCGIYKVYDLEIQDHHNFIASEICVHNCNSPNLQQIPARVGGLIRNAFIADEGRLLASMDFSQQELRVLAHVSRDEALMQAFLEGRDIHSLTATGMWNRKHPDDVVTYEYFMYCRELLPLFQDVDGNLDESKFSEENLNKLLAEGKLRSVETLREDIAKGKEFDRIRSSAKVVNFGIIYGMTAKGLADALEVTEEDAEKYIQGYFDAYPGVKRWMREQEEQIRKHMFTTTMLKRKRRVYPEMTSGQRWLEARGVRQGINSIIQGSSADMVKLASIKLQPLLEELDAQIVLWVHDELIVDVPESIGMENLQKITKIMCTALPLDCGLRSDIEVGRKWGQRMSEDVLAKLAMEEEEEDE